MFYIITAHAIKQKLLTSSNEMNTRSVYITHCTGCVYIISVGCVQVQAV